MGRAVAPGAYLGPRALWLCPLSAGAPCPPGTLPPRPRAGSPARPSSHKQSPFLHEALPDADRTGRAVIRTLGSHAVPAAPVSAPGSEGPLPQRLGCSPPRPGCSHRGCFLCFRLAFNL